MVRHPHNVGYGRSLKNGIAAAQYDMIAICDADGTYPAAAIPELVRLHREGFDMAVGRRQGPHYRESMLKMPMRALLRFLVEWTAGRHIPDINSGLRVFSRAAVMQYFAHLCDTFSFTTSLTLAYMMTGRFVAYAPIDYFERAGRSKVRLFRDALRTLQYIVEAILYYNPLKLFLLFSLICLVACRPDDGGLVLFRDRHRHDPGGRHRDGLGHHLRHRPPGGPAQADHGQGLRRRKFTMLIAASSKISVPLHETAVETAVSWSSSGARAAADLFACPGRDGTWPRRRRRLERMQGIDLTPTSTTEECVELGTGVQPGVSGLVQRDHVRAAAGRPRLSL